MQSLSLTVILAFLCVAFVLKSVLADNVDDGSILSGKSDSVPIIGEVNAGIGATIDVSAIKAAQEEEEKETPPPPPILTLDDFKKKSVKQLKEYLKERGLECKGCSEKADFVKLAYDHRETPVTSTQTPSEEKKSGISDVPDGEKLDQAKIDELLANLKRSGFGNNRFFNADDLRDLNPEELNAKFNDPNYKPKSAKNSKKSSDKSKKTGGKKEGGSSSSSGSSSKSKAKTESKPKPQKKKADPKPSKPSSSTPVQDQEEETIEL